MSGEYLTLAIILLLKLKYVYVDFYPITFYGFQSCDRRLAAFEVPR